MSVLACCEYRFSFCALIGLLMGDTCMQLQVPFSLRLFHHPP
jgi:hypothetical protein